MYILEYENWSYALEIKLETTLETPPKDPLSVLQEAKIKFIENNTIARDKGRYGCGFCKKNFVAENFAEKHIALKHAEEMAKYEEIKADEAFFENYERDSNRFELRSVESVIPGDVTDYHHQRQYIHNTINKYIFIKENTYKKLKIYNYMYFN